MELTVREYIDKYLSTTLEQLQKMSDETIEREFNWLQVRSARKTVLKRFTKMMDKLIKLEDTNPMIDFDSYSLEFKQVQKVGESSYILILTSIDDDDPFYNVFITLAEGSLTRGKNTLRVYCKEKRFGEIDEVYSGNWKGLLEGVFKYNTAEEFFANNDFICEDR
jgi:hypothetical protein